MKTTNRKPVSNPQTAVAAVRARIEREFLALGEQESRILHLALNEAEALAWQTGFAHLVFPALAQEKARSLCSWHARQQSIRPTASIRSFAACRTK